MANKKISVGALMLVRMVNDEVCYLTPSGEQIVNRRAVKRLEVLADVWNNKLNSRVKVAALIKK